MVEPLTKAEFNDIGEQAFINWFESIRVYTTLPYDVDIAKAMYVHCDTIYIVIVTSNNIKFIFGYDHTVNDKWFISYGASNYKSSQAIQSVINSFNKFIEIEQTKLIATPYGKDIVREIEELFH